MSYTGSDNSPMPATMTYSYDGDIHIRSHTKEPIMLRLFPITLGALQLGLVAASTYVLCSADVLTSASIFLAR